MPENQQIETNETASISSNGPLDHIQEGVSKMKIEEEEERREYPNREGEPDCIYYLRTGTCGYGSSCRFNHPPPSKIDKNKSELPLREGQPDCGYFLKTGTCKYGSMCKYHHPVDRRNVGQLSLNALGLPIREEKPCPFYLRTFTCKFGAACKFDHPQPAAIETALSVSGPMAAGVGSALPSTRISYIGALPAWSFTKSSYVVPSGVPAPQSYMPVVIPPLQGPVAAQNWNNYLRSMNSVAASSVMGTDLILNKNPGGHLDLLTTTSSGLPERPDQPDCRYFMNTGSCKYGTNCKFHHPREKISHNLGPHGLPLRPGEDICAHFSSYGICQYGSTCKFSHPITGYIPSYYFGTPSLPVLNQPFFPNQRNLVISNSTETSPSKSSKITDWIQKPETVGGKNLQNSVTKAVEDPHEPVGDDSNDASGPNLSDIPHDHTD